MSEGRTCTKCSTFKPWSDFRRSAGRTSGRKEQCKACDGKRDRAYYRVNRVRIISGMKRWREQNTEKSDGHKLKHKFNITLDDFKAMEVACGGKCQICGNPETRRGRKNLSVDHDHESGRIRGLLCANCNMGVGSFQDSPDLLAAAIEYLKKHSEVRAVA